MLGAVSELGGRWVRRGVLELCVALVLVAGVAPVGSVNVSAAGAVRPAVPGKPTVTVTDGSLLVSWAAPTSGVPIADYVVQRATSSSGPYSQVTEGSCATHPLTVTACTVTGSTVGTGYYFKVAVSSVGGASRASAKVTAAALPGAVVGLTCSLVSARGVAKVLWGAAARNGARIIRYEQSFKRGSQDWGAWVSNRTSVRLSLTGLTSDVGFNVRVRAVNAMGTGPTNSCFTGDYAATATVNVASNPYGAAFDGTSIWVTSSTGSGSVSKINTTTNTVTATVTVGVSPVGVAFDGTSIWVANRESGTVSKINTTTNTLTATVTVGVDPVGVAFDGTSIWVTNAGSGTVSKINPTTNSVTATVAVGGSPFGVAFDGTSIWVTSSTGSGSVSKINTTTNTVTATVTVGASPQGVAFDGTSIWVANTNSGTVSKINTTTNTVTATVTVGARPQGVAFDGTSIWVAKLDSFTVSRINPTTDTVTATSTVGGPAQVVAFDGTSIWVSQPATSTMLKISI